VLLMEISQAAFGLDMRAASRIYFLSPVLNPQVEAQAIGRARRISQQKPVTVETLVLRGSIEEVIVERKNEMTQAEHRKCKSILDDRPIYNWIRSVKISAMPADIPDHEQTAPLSSPQFLFGRRHRRATSGDDGLLHDHGPVSVAVSAEARSGSPSVAPLDSLKRKHTPDVEAGTTDETAQDMPPAKRRVRFTDGPDEEAGTTGQAAQEMPPAKRRVRFADGSNED